MKDNVVKKGKSTCVKRYDAWCSQSNAQTVDVDKLRMSVGLMSAALGVSEPQSDAQSLLWLFHKALFTLLPEERKEGERLSYQDNTTVDGHARLSRLIWKP